MGVIAQHNITNGGPYYVDYLCISQIAVYDERNANSTRVRITSRLISSWFFTDARAEFKPPVDRSYDFTTSGILAGCYFFKRLVANIQK